MTQMHNLKTKVKLVSFIFSSLPYQVHCIAVQLKLLLSGCFGFFFLFFILLFLLFFFSAVFFFSVSLTFVGSIQAQYFLYMHISTYTQHVKHYIFYFIHKPISKYYHQTHEKPSKLFQLYLCVYYSTLNILGAVKAFDINFIL